jgi:hypothetical protein
MTTQIPEITQEYIDKIFEELGKMQIVLDKEPLRFGPSRLNEKVAVTRNMLTRCEQLFNSVSHHLQLYSLEKRKADLTFSLNEKNLIANDPEVRAGRNLKDREAVAHLKLRKEIESLTFLEATVHNLEIVLSMVKAKRSDLRDVQGRLKDQIKLCQEDIGIGRRWGHEKTQASPKPIVTPDMAEELLSPINESYQAEQVTEQDVSEGLVDIDALLDSVDQY